MKIPFERIQQTRTPFYYYDTELLKSTLDEISRHTADRPDFDVHYAVKANVNPTLLRIIADRGFGADCVSGGEIRTCIEAGFSPEKIVFAGVGKSDWEINLALQNDIACFNVESLPELEVINELAAIQHKTARVAFRINPNVDAHTHANITTGLPENKFGIAMDDMLTAIRRAQKLSHVHYVGLHFHIGSQILDFTCYKLLCERINQLQMQLEGEGIATESINVGGGVGIDYQAPDQNPIPDFATYFNLFKENLQLRKGQKLHFELGRSIVGQCGSLITKVLYVKETKIKNFLIVDAGFTDLIRPALYDAYHKIEKISPETEDSASQTTYDVVGPICESSDVFDKDVCLPTCRRGDYIALRSAGAYGEIMASQYNCRQLPGALTSDDTRTA